MQTQTGQLGLDSVAWWMRVCPRFPFFWLSIFSQMMVGGAGPLQACSQVRLLVAEKKAMSRRQNCWVQVVWLRFGMVYLPTRKRKQKAIRQSSPVAQNFAEPFLDSE